MDEAKKRVQRRNHKFLQLRAEIHPGWLIQGKGKRKRERTASMRFLNTKESGSHKRIFHKTKDQWQHLAHSQLTPNPLILLSPRQHCHPKKKKRTLITYPLKQSFAPRSILHNIPFYLLALGCVVILGVVIALSLALRPDEDDEDRTPGGVQVQVDTPSITLPNIGSINRTATGPTSEMQAEVMGIFELLWRNHLKFIFQSPI